MIEEDVIAIASDREDSSRSDPVCKMKPAKRRSVGAIVG